MPISFGFLRPDLSPWGYRNRCVLVALCCLIVRRPNVEVVTLRVLHQQVKILGSFSALLAHGSLHMKVCPYSYFWWCGYFWGPWVSFVICHIWVLSEDHKNYFKDWCFMNSQPTFLFLTYFNSRNYGHIMKSM